MSDALALVLRLNLAVSAAVVAVLLLRGPTRRLFGPRAAYGLWSLAPLAVLAMLLPARVVAVKAAPMADSSVTAMSGAGAWTPAATASAPALPAPTWILAGVWMAGAAYAFARLAWRQGAFTRAERIGTAGPAAVGVLKPRIVV